MLKPEQYQCEVVIDQWLDRSPHTREVPGSIPGGDKIPFLEKFKTAQGLKQQNLKFLLILIETTSGEVLFLLSLLLLLLFM